MRHAERVKLRIADPSPRAIIHIRTGLDSWHFFGVRVGTSTESTSARYDVSSSIASAKYSKTSPSYIRYRAGDMVLACVRWGVGTVVRNFTFRSSAYRNGNPCR